MTIAFPLASAIAQSPTTISLRIDNDAFDFWMLPWNRPDEEYTSGVHLTYDGGSAPWWSRALIGRGPACNVGATECRTQRAELGQDIYTPALSVDDPKAAAGSRANAGWLYVSQAARLLRTDRSDEFALTIGVTGPPSLAQQTQRLAHDVVPAFNRPESWNNQIRFQPGAIVRYEQRRLVVIANGNAIGFDVVPHIAAAVGNVATNGELGLQSRLGVHLPHPWLSSDGRFSMTLVAGAMGKAIVRDLFLDGNTIPGGPHVGHAPIVGEGELGMELRYRWLNLTYRAVNDTRSYRRGPAWHPWASMVAAVTFDR